MSAKAREQVNHPAHYNAGTIEVIDVIEDWGLGFHLGNVLKYIARAPHKGDPIGDLGKAEWYADRLAHCDWALSTAAHRRATSTPFAPGQVAADWHFGTLLSGAVDCICEIAKLGRSGEMKLAKTYLVMLRCLIGAARHGFVVEEIFTAQRALLLEDKG